MKFICLALMAVRSRDESLDTPTRAAEVEVMRRIRPHFHVGRWLTAQGYRNASDDDAAELLAYRHRWLDSLIAEFSTP